MTVEALFWLWGITLVLLLVAAAAVLRLTMRNRHLQEEVRELDHALGIEAAVAGHAKPPNERRVALVINGAKPESDDVARMVHSVCSRAGMPKPLLLPTSAQDAGHAMTEEALAAGADVVIAAGGDGTIRAVAATLSRAAQSAGAGAEGARSSGAAGGEQAEAPAAALGVVPLGTGNLFARNIGLPLTDLQACVDDAIHGMSHRVDTLELVLERPDGAHERDFSLVIAGGGLDAEVMHDTRETLKQRAGWLAYGEAGLRHVMGRRRAVTISLDGGEPKSFRVRSVLLANCGSLQAGMLLVPSAKFDDGRMDAVLFTPRHAWDWAKIVTKTITRFSADIPVMTVRQARRSRVTMSEPLPFQIDGDPVGEVLSVEATVRPASLIVNGVNTRVLESPVPDVPAP